MIFFACSTLISLSGQAVAAGDPLLLFNYVKRR